MELGEAYTTDMEGCARCHGEHPGITFVRLIHPIPAKVGEFTHWAPCPTNGQPILLRQEPSSPRDLSEKISIVGL